MRKQSLWQEIKRKKSCYLYILPFGILFFTFTVLPVIMSIFLSFTNYNVFSMPQFVGFSNYIQLIFNDKIFLKSVINTITIAVVTGPFGYIASFLIAWMIDKLGRRIQFLMVLLIYSPSISGNLYTIWAIIFSDDANGYLNSILSYFGLIDTNVYWLTDKKYMMMVVIIVSLWMSMGAGFLSFVAGIKGVDRSQLEAGAIDGIRNRWQELWYIILPSMKPQLLFGAVMSINSAFACGAVSTAMCGMPSTDYAVHTIVNHLTDYGTTRFEMGYASAIATVLFLAMILCKKVIQNLLSKVG